MSCVAELLCRAVDKSMATVAATLVGRDDWIIPASLLLGAVSIGSDWISLRQRGMPLSARVSDMMAASG
jgi:hypothetical protein